MTIGTARWRMLHLELSVLCILFVGCWQEIRTPPSRCTQSTTGSLGRYKFTSGAMVTAFNSEVSEWFLTRGFSRVEGKTFNDIVGKGNGDWKEPGLLLCAKNRIFVFIPDCYDPENNVQIIGYHRDFSGTVEDGVRDRHDFDQLCKEFVARFPANGGPNDIDGGEKGN